MMFYDIGDQIVSLDGTDQGAARLTTAVRPVCTGDRAPSERRGPRAVLVVAWSQVVIARHVYCRTSLNVAGGHDTVIRSAPGVFTRRLITLAKAYCNGLTSVCLSVPSTYSP